nr:MotA/TolQ/ExbB proton channel family protein [bacterium]
VLGMMDAFNVIAFHEGMGSPEMLAVGIAKALVTTAAGLIIAIPAMGFSYYFRTGIQRLSAQAQELASELVPYISKQI